VDNTQEYTCLSLCSGYGGLELGLRRVVPTLRTIAYVEVEAFAVANLVAKMETGFLDAAPVWTDIKTFDAESFRDKVHFITAGYPCQGESVAGKCLGDKDPRWLWPHIRRIIETVRPVWFFGENVANHINLGYPAVYGSLRDMGYTVEAGLFSAAECGFIHKRERLYILAYSSSNRLQRKLQENLKKETGAPKAFSSRTIWQNEIDLPEPYTCGAFDGDKTRVDRLRLLGNGVVPQQAERAFRYLINEISQ
jgi:site-specific DNA-cytosine methylase